MQLFLEFPYQTVVVYLCFVAGGRSSIPQRLLSFFRVPPLYRCVALFSLLTFVLSEGIALSHQVLATHLKNKQTTMSFECGAFIV